MIGLLEMVKIKGVRDIQTLYERTHRARSRTRAQVVSELAYLEHEKDRINRELSAWHINQKQAESRLGFVRERIVQLKGILEEGLPTKRQSTVPSEEAEDGSLGVQTPWQEISLEY